MGAGLALEAHVTCLEYTSSCSENLTRGDLGGVAGNFVEVGTANQIWEGRATISAAEISSALSQNSSPGHTNIPLQDTPWCEANTQLLNISNQDNPSLEDIITVRNALLADFQTADREWARWTPQQ